MLLSRCDFCGDKWPKAGRRTRLNASLRGFQMLTGPVLPRRFVPCSRNRFARCDEREKLCEEKETFFFFFFNSLIRSQGRGTHLSRFINERPSFSNAGLKFGNLESNRLHCVWWTYLVCTRTPCFFFFWSDGSTLRSCRYRNFAEAWDALGWWNENCRLESFRRFSWWCQLFKGKSNFWSDKNFDGSERSF